MNLVDPWGLESRYSGYTSIYQFSSAISSTRAHTLRSTAPRNTKVGEIARGAAYAVGKAVVDTADIAVNGPPLAQAALGLAFVSEAAPLAIISAYTMSPAALYPYILPAAEFVESANPGMLPPHFSKAGILGWATGTIAESACK